jgi:hypothetical protein
MPDTSKPPAMREITPGERRELRSVVRGQYKVLRAEVKRREQEMKSEVETELLNHYRAEDHAINQAQEESREIIREASRQIEALGRELKMSFPDLTVQAGDRYGSIGLQASNPNKTQLHRALIAKIPETVGDANLTLDRQENDLLRKLSEGALESSEARGFLSDIPTVGQLVPRIRLQEIESAANHG